MVTIPIYCNKFLVVAMGYVACNKFVAILVPTCNITYFMAITLTCCNAKKKLYTNTKKPWQFVQQLATIFNLFRQHRPIATDFSLLPWAIWQHDKFVAKISKPCNIAYFVAITRRYCNKKINYCNEKHMWLYRLPIATNFQMVVIMPIGCNENSKLL